MNNSFKNKCLLQINNPIWSNYSNIFYIFEIFLLFSGEKNKNYFFLISIKIVGIIQIMKKIYKIKLISSRKS
jgi:hypothetical protein